MRRPRGLLPTWMLETGGRNRRPRWPPAPPVRPAVPRADGSQARIEALAKLKALFDTGVLTPQQFSDEWERLLDE